MDAFYAEVGIGGVIGLGLGLLAILLLSAIAARLSKVIDLLDEIADMVPTVRAGKTDETSPVR